MVWQVAYNVVDSIHLGDDRQAHIGELILQQLQVQGHLPQIATITDLET